MAFDKNKLPQLPFGEGTINTFNDNLLIYKKTVKTSDGKKHRVSVYAETPQGCFKKMRAKELELENSKVKAKFEILTDAMNDWCDNVHKKTVKPQTYDRLKKTIRNQIAKHSIGSMQYQTVNSTDIQRHLDQLNKGGYSHSVIKKTHDALNAFYRYASLRDERSNRCIDFWGENANRKTQVFLDNALEVLSENRLCVLRVSDFNTSGLSGASFSKAI